MFIDNIFSILKSNIKVKVTLFDKVFNLLISKELNTYKSVVTI